MEASNILDLTDANFRREVLEADRPVLVDFTAQWCGPCKAMAPALDALAAEYAGKVKVAKLDVEQNQDTAEQFGIRAMPTLLFFKGGKVVGQIVGAVPKARLDEALKRVV